MAQNSTSKLKAFTRKLKAVKAGDIMTKHVITTTEDAHLADVAEIMLESRISGMPVVNKKGKVIGIITENDLFVVMDMIKSGDVMENGKLAVSNPTVRFSMSTEISQVKKTTSLDEILVIMKFRNKHTIPVFDKGRMVGVVGRRDVFKSFYNIVKELYL
ncbi:MAG: CBS domain-containing protein [Candidatus Ancaeobacter aquaticus]|nr:CBS domain-containing protein [Candidatus Ancaeobacter aquaticus]